MKVPPRTQTSVKIAVTLKKDTLYLPQRVSTGVYIGNEILPGKTRKLTIPSTQNEFTLDKVVLKTEPLDSYKV